MAGSPRNWILLTGLHAYGRRRRGLVRRQPGRVAELLRNGGVPARRPPSMVTVVPVMNALSGDASETAGGPTPPAPPTARTAPAAGGPACAWAPAAARRSVRMGPGAMAL